MNELLLTVAAVLIPINWAISMELVRLARRYPDLVSLRERAFAAVVLAVTVTVLVLVAVLASGGLVDQRDASGLRRLFLVVLSVPALYWLWLYRHK